jgi:hypothetical protein
VALLKAMGWLKPGIKGLALAFVAGGLPALVSIVPTEKSNKPLSKATRQDKEGVILKSRKIKKSGKLTGCSLLVRPA